MSTATGSGSAAATSPVPTVTLGHELTIQCATETVSSIATALDGAPPALHLDLAAVEDLDTAGIQVLVWAARESGGRGTRLHLTGSDAVDAALGLAGLDLATLGTGVAR